MRKFRMYLVGRKTTGRSGSFPGEYTLEEVNQNLNSKKAEGLEYEVREIITEERVVEIQTIIKRKIV